MDTTLFKFVTVDIRVLIVTITIYVTFREPNATLVVLDIVTTRLVKLLMTQACC
jgi:hypothetical protein